MSRPESFSNSPDPECPVPNFFELSREIPFVPVTEKNIKISICERRQLIFSVTSTEKTTCIYMTRKQAKASLNSSDKRFKKLEFMTCFNTPTKNFRDLDFFSYCPGPVCPVPKVFELSRPVCPVPKNFRDKSRLSRGTGQTGLFGIRDCPAGL